MRNSEIEVDGHIYQIGPMNTFVQFHIARRLGPLAPTILMYLENSDPDKSVMDLFFPLMGTISTLSDADSEYILNQCLSVVTRKQESGWAKVQSSGGLMFDDITMPNMLQIVWQVILKDIADFFPSVPAISTGIPAA